MDEKEMRSQFEECMLESDLDFSDWKTKPSGSYWNQRLDYLWQGWRFAYGWHAESSNAVYQVKGNAEVGWVDVSKKMYEGVKDKNETRILYTAPPMQNAEREIVLAALTIGDFVSKTMGEAWLEESVKQNMRAAVELNRKGRS